MSASAGISPPPAGWAIQGEISNRLNQPIQFAASDQALTNNAPAVCYLGQLLGPQLGASADTLCKEAHNDPTITLMGGVPKFGQIVDGWKRYPVTQIQSTATKLFTGDPSLYINSIAVVGEIGLDYVHNFDKNSGVYNAAFSTDTNSAFVRGATVNGGNYAGPAVLSTGGFATQTSAAYTIAVIVDMPDLLPDGIGMKPTVSLQHDFFGTSPTGVNVFQKNSAAISVGSSFSYLEAWGLNIQYTRHFMIGNGAQYNGELDRDFVSADVTYEF